jgi:hypothetical protein
VGRDGGGKGRQGATHDKRKPGGPVVNTKEHVMRSTSKILLK